MPLSPTVRFRKSLAGGPPVVVCEIPGRGGAFGISWGVDEAIVFGSTEGLERRRRRHRRRSSRRIRKKTASAGQSLRPMARRCRSSSGQVGHDVLGIAVPPIGGNDRRTLVEGATYPRLTANNILVFTRDRPGGPAQHDRQRNRRRADPVLEDSRDRHGAVRRGHRRHAGLYPRWPPAASGWSGSIANGQAESAVSEKLGGIYHSPMHLSPRKAGWRSRFTSRRPGSGVCLTDVDSLAD